VICPSEVQKRLSILLPKPANAVAVLGVGDHIDSRVPSQVNYTCKTPVLSLMC